MVISSMPNRPLKVPELRAIGERTDDTAPMVIRPDPAGSDIFAATIIQEHQVTAIVLEHDGWQILDRQDRPHPPAEFEKQYAEWAEEYPDLVCLCS
jgi:hypothetical protein